MVFMFLMLSGCKDNVCSKMLVFTLFCLQEHSGRVFRLQFDEFQIVSSSHDDTIIIWDFLNVPTPEYPRLRLVTYGYEAK